jgi:hypothetical protein
VKTRFAAASAALVLAALGLTGCGDAQQAKEKVDLKQSAAWLKDAEAVQYTISAPIDAATLKKLNEDESEDPAPQEVLDLVGKVSVVVTGSPKDKSAPAAISVRVGSADLVSVVVTQKDLYAKLDAAQIPASLTDQLKKKGANLTQVAGMLDMVAPGAGDLLRNKWVHIKTDQLKDAGSLASAVPSPDAVSMEKVNQAFESLLSKAAIVQDEKDPSHSVATVQGDDVRATLKTVLDEQAKAQGGDESGPTGKLRKKLEGDGVNGVKEVKIDLYTTDGDLQRVRVDIAQFAPADDPAPGPLPVEVAFSKAKPVVAPSDAKDVDLSKIEDNMKGMMGGSGLDG